MLSQFDRFEDAILHDLFPEADAMLREGKHIDRDDGQVYEYLQDALDHLEPFYRRYNADLIYRPDGYFYLLPNTGLLRSTRLSPGEMLVGQVLALLYLDPSTVANAGVISREIVLEWSSNMLDLETMVMTLNHRKRKFSERTAISEAKKGIRTALNTLKKLGFIHLDRDSITLRPALMRFADPVREFDDHVGAMKRLIAHGEVEVDATYDDEDLPGEEE